MIPLMRLMRYNTRKNKILAPLIETEQAKIEPKPKRPVGRPRKVCEE